MEEVCGSKPCWDCQHKNIFILDPPCSNCFNERGEENYKPAFQPKGEKEETEKSSARFEFKTTWKEENKSVC